MKIRYVIHVSKLGKKRKEYLKSISEIVYEEYGSKSELISGVLEVDFYLTAYAMMIWFSVMTKGSLIGLSSDFLVCDVQIKHGRVLPNLYKIEDDMAMYDHDRSSLKCDDDDSIDQYKQACMILEREWQCKDAVGAYDEGAHDIDKWLDGSLFIKQIK